MVVSIIIAVVLAVIFIGYRVAYADKSTVNGIIGTFIKALASLGFISVAFTAVYSCGANGEGVNVGSASFLILGLIMGLIGDIVLDLKVVYQGRKEEDVYLTGGMASFGIGHILFFVAILLYLNAGSRTVLTGAHIGICVAVSAVIAFVLVFGGEKFLHFKFGKFIIHSVIYAFFLVFMSAIGITGWAIYPDNKHMPLFAIGMLLFLLSDLVLTKMYFGGKKNDKFLCVLNHALYYSAQICIASFVFYMYL